MGLEPVLIGISGGTISVLLAIVSFFLWRVFNQIDKLTESHQSLAISLREVVIEIKGIKKDVSDNRRTINKNLFTGDARC